MRNITVVKKAFADFDKQIIETTRMELNKWCWAIIEAAVSARENNPNGHDFTGNLLNSIVVCLYENGDPYVPYYPSDIGVLPAIRKKMKKRLRKRVFFNPDYRGENSAYFPTVETDGGWGRQDAENFFASYRPQSKNMFDIVVAYTVEYADWVEQQRQTTGILQTKQFVVGTGMRLLQLKSA